MEYLSGQTVQIGDLVEISDGSPGVVVVIVDEGLARPDFDIDDWSYLNEGVIVDTKKAGIIHYPKKFLYHLSFVARTNDVNT